jgi:hypothetical protein
MLATEGMAGPTPASLGSQVLVAVVAVVAAASVLVAVVALASWVRALAVTAAPPAAAVLVAAAAEGLAVQTEHTILVEFTVGVLESLALAMVVAAPYVLFGPAQTYPLARSHQQTQGMYK